MTGKGQTVAIVDAYASPTMLSDANEYARITGDRPFKPGQYTQYLASTFTLIDECGGSGWYGEEALDVESVHGQAPDANVAYVDAAMRSSFGHRFLNEAKARMTSCLMSCSTLHADALRHVGNSSAAAGAWGASDSAVGR